MPEYSVGYGSIDKAITDKMADLAQPLIDGPPINRYLLWLQAKDIVAEELRTVAALSLEKAVLLAPADESNLVADVQDRVTQHVREGYGDQPFDADTQAMIDAMPTAQQFVHRRNAVFRPQDPEAPLGGAQ